MCDLYAEVVMKVFKSRDSAVVVEYFLPKFAVVVESTVP
jgi:hypothetical protein